MFDRDDITGLAAHEIAAAVRSGELKALDIVTAYLRAIDAATDLNAFITVCAERALAKADVPIDGPLAGVPVAVKDMFDVAGVRATRGTALFADHVPSRTAAAVTMLEDAGAIVVGKANQHEIAWGVTSQNPHWGNVRNPVRPDRTPGGSSGGNAAALAGRLSALGIGTDTGGSGRIPSACCGTVGFKPKRTTITTRGCFPLAPSFDTVAPMSRSVRDCALAFAVLAGRPFALQSMRGVKVASLTPMPSLAKFADLGAIVTGVISLPAPRVELSMIFEAQAGVTHSRWFPARKDEYGPDAQAKLRRARAVRAVDYFDAMAELRRWRATVAETCVADLIITPTLGSPIPAADVYEPGIRDKLGQYTRLFSYLDWAAIAVGSLQIAGPDEDTVLSAALEWERAFGIVKALPKARIEPDGTASAPKLPVPSTAAAAPSADTSTR